MTAPDSPEDPLQRAWSRLFVGDAPGNRWLETRVDGSCQVVAAVPTGETEPRTVRIGGQPVSIDVPATREELLATGTLEEVARELDRISDADEAAARAAMTDAERAEQTRRAARWGAFVAREQAKREAWTTTSVDLGPADKWLVRQPSGTAQAVCAGQPVTCTRCDGSGRAYEVTCNCRRIVDLTTFETGAADPDCPDCSGRGTTDRTCNACAGTGMRRTRVDIRLADERGNTEILELSAHTLKVTELRHEADADRYPLAEDEVLPDSWTELRLDWTGWATTRIDLPPADRRLMIVDGYARIWPRYGWTWRHGLDGLVARLLDRIPIESHPDLDAGSRPATPAERERRLLECAYDDHHRLARQTWHVRTRRPTSQAWSELTVQTARLRAALPAGWDAQIWLATGAIATGEHGPSIQLVAIPPHPLGRPIAVLSDLGYTLEEALETVVWRALESSVEKLAHEATAQNEADG